MCLPPAGDPGGLLTIGLWPGHAEDNAGLPNVGQSGTYLHREILRWWDGPIAHCNAVNCTPGRRTKDVGPKHVDACRGYVAAYLRDVQPTRILALGEWAVYSLFGYKTSPMSARRGFGWLPNGAPIRCACGASYAWRDGGPVCSRSARHDRPRAMPIPVIFLFHPAAAVRNRYLRPEFEGDLQWALETPDEEFQRRYFHVMGGHAHLIDTEEDAKIAVAALRIPEGDTQGTITTDIESRGRLHNDDFKIISFAVCRSGSAEAYVWDRDAIDKGLSKSYVELTQDPSQTWVTHSHFDDRGLHCFFGAPIAGTRRDTRLLHKLAYPDVDADLGTVSDFVGVGFYKNDMKVHLDQAIATARKQGARQTPFDFAASLDDYAQRAIVEGYKQLGGKFDPGAYAYALVPRKELSAYVARDVVVTGLYHEEIWPKIRADEGLALVWDQIRQPASKSFHWMAYWGIPIDRGAVQTMMWAAQNEQADLGLRLRRYLRGEYQNVSLASTEQVGDFLFGPRSRGAYQLPPQKLTEKEKRPSTDKEALEQLDAYLRKELETRDDPVFREALEFLDLYTLYTEKDGFIEKGAEFLRYLCKDDRVHPSYLLDGTRTGRPSCIAAGSMVEVVRDVSAHPKGVAIEQVKEGDLVYCYDKNRELCLRRVLWAGKTGRRRVVRLHWQGSGHRRKGYLDLTPEHPVRLTDGHYRQAQHLKPMDRVMALSRAAWCERNHEVLEVVDLGTEVDVYDITVEGEHNFIVNELCVHNSSSPNAFNMKRPDECEECRGKGCTACLNTGVDQEAQRVRNCFVAPEGFLFLEADESQIELRGMAALGKDPVLTKAFVEGRDVHESAAEAATKGSGTHVTRQQAKPVNFGASYNISAQALAKRLKCSVEQAQKILTLVMGSYTGVLRLKREMLDFVMNHGYTYTVWFVENADGTWSTKRAARRPLPDIGAEDGARRSQATNGAFASLIQGTFSGFLVLAAHAAMVEWILAEGLQDDIQLVLTVYDSLVFLCRKQYIPMLAKKVVYEMTRFVIGYLDDGVTPFPLKSDVKVGPALGSLSKLKVPD